MCIYYEMITILKLINTFITSHNYNCVCLCTENTQDLLSLQLLFKGFICIHSACKQIYLQEGKISFHSLCRDRKSRVAGPLYREISSIGPYIFMQMEQVKLNAFIFFNKYVSLKKYIFFTTVSLDDLLREKRCQVSVAMWQAHTTKQMSKLTNKKQGLLMVHCYRPQ